jgi:hypothetical protein
MKAASLPDEPLPEEGPLIRIVGEPDSVITSDG